MFLCLGVRDAASVLSGWVLRAQRSTEGSRRWGLWGGLSGFRPRYPAREARVLTGVTGGDEAQGSPISAGVGDPSPALPPAGAGDGESTRTPARPGAPTRCCCHRPAARDPLRPSVVLTGRCRRRGCGWCCCPHAAAFPPPPAASPI